MSNLYKHSLTIEKRQTMIDITDIIKEIKLYKDIFRTSSELLIKNEIIDFEGEKIKKKRLHFIMKYV